MGIRRGNIVPFSRDYRRAPKFDMGLPNGRPPRRRRKGWIVAAIGALFLFGPPVVDAANGLMKPANGCRVYGVVDGDTVRMYCAVSGFTTGRVLAYDTPEYKARCTSEFFGAIKATFYLRWLLWSANEITARTEGTDRYGRALTLLLVDGKGVAGEMVKAGLARWYDGGPRASWCQ